MASDAPLSPVSEAARKKHFRELAERDAVEETSPQERELLRRSRDLLSERRDSGEITDDEEELLDDIEHLLNDA